ncbi:hypothetical protein [Alienimonas sp. DA493]|uniref:hypothetical protein n=1 Tax=Alienimonas sp. DA493 TaxID=3373605 RepID=UPI00375406F8
MKASDRQELAKTITPLLQKEYGPPPPEADRPVLETLIFSVLLEDLPVETAERAYESLTGAFFDLNEIRVSTIAEISATLEGLPRPELRAHRIRTVLQTVFEDGYTFTLEPIRKKTLEQAQKTLEGIRDLSTFSRQYTLQHALSGHAVPVDGTTGRAAVWLGLAEGDEETGEIDEAEIADSLKSAIRKADAPEFNHLLRAFATDERFKDLFGKKWAIPDGGYNPADAAERLKKTLADPLAGLPPTKKKAAKPKAAAKSKAAKTSAEDAEETSKASAKKADGSKSTAKSSKSSSKAKKPAKAAAKSSAKS